MKKKLLAVLLTVLVGVTSVLPAGVVPAAETEAALPPATAEKAPGKPAIRTAAYTKAGTVKVTLKKKVSGASGYQLSYAANSKFTGAKTKKFTGTSVTLKGLAKKTYYFKVRAYKKSGTNVVYGKWSGVKKAAVKEEGTFTYKTPNFSLQLPVSWKGKYVAYQGAVDGMPWLAFYEKQCFQELDQQGGWLFSIGAYKDDSYMEMPSYEVIKKGKTYTYAANFPTDVQFEGASKTARANYGRMMSQVETILASFREL